MSKPISSTSSQPQFLSSIPPSSTTDSSSEAASTPNTISNSKTHYNHVTVFDKFNISSLITNDLLIPKTSSNTFLYKRELDHKHKPSSKPDAQQPELQAVVSEINKNHFGIRIDKLVIHYPNDRNIKFMSVYTPVKYIGQGAFGLVIAVIKNETKEHYAVKIIKKNYNLFSNSTYLNEVALLKKLKHPRILNLHEVLDTNEYLFLFTEHIQGGSLKDFIMSRYTNVNSNNNDYFIKDSECSTIIRALLEAVAYLHKNNIMHRDLKPENIMFKNKDDLNSLIICDFGIAGEIATFEFTKCKCGTLLYMAPEILNNRPYDFLVDLWSVGIILYILESGGKHPIFVQGIEKRAFIKETRTKKEWEFPLHFPNVARNLFMKLCKRDSFFRYRTDKALKHPWILRQVNIEIPLTLVEVFEKEDKVKRFQNMLLCGVMLFHLYKDVQSKTVEHKHDLLIKGCSFKKRNIMSAGYNNDTINISSMNLNYKKFHPHHNKSSKLGYVSVRDKIHSNKHYENKYYLTNISHVNNNNDNNHNHHDNETKCPRDTHDNIVHTSNAHVHRKYKTQTYRNEPFIKKAKTQTDFLVSECEANSVQGGCNVNSNRLRSLNTQSSNSTSRKISFFSKQKKENSDVLVSSSSNKKMLLKVNKSPVKIMSVKTGFVYMDKCHWNNKHGMSSRLLMLREIRHVRNKENKELTAQMKSTHYGNGCKSNRISYSKDERKRVKTSRFPRRTLTKSSFGYLRSEFE